VIAIIPTADRAKATVKVRIGFDARDDRILPEMGVRVAFLDAPASAPAEGAQPSSAQRPLVVPPDAVQATGDAGVVFVLNDDRVERRSVRLGARVAAGQVVLSGLTAGTRIAAGDVSKLADGANVRVEN
jgi:multidrug efflux pump subunit AcrA (membrane-fusion protein)